MALEWKIRNGNRKIQISYTVEDVVTDYKDCQEIYWKFFAEGQNSIPAKKVTGKLILPTEVQNIGNLRVWGHGQLNGKIEKLNNSEVSFEMDNLSPGAMFEIRVVTQDKMFVTSPNKVYNYNYLQTILKEEQKWADESNASANAFRTIIIILFVIYGVILIIRIINIIRLLKLGKEEIKRDNFSKFKYFRDIPREQTATPAEALYLYKFDKKRLDTGTIQSNAVSATILNLCYKKKISLRVDEKDNVYIKILSDKSDLKDDELEIYKLLKDASKGKEEFEIKELNAYAKNKYYEYSTIINKFVNSARNSLYKLGLIDKRKERTYAKYEFAEGKKTTLKYSYMFFIILCLIAYFPIFKTRLTYASAMPLIKNLIYILIALLPWVLISIYYWNLQIEQRNKIAVLTNEGKEEKAKWKGLAKFMQEYSMLDEKDVLSLVIWEKYLIYATAFGIADKVIEQMKSKYPEVFIKEKWDDETMKENYPIIYFAINPIYNVNNFHSISNLSVGVSSAYSTSMREIASHASSSGSGGGGGFSGGGGGRRWPEAGMGGR